MKTPHRVAVVGAGGFIGKSFVQYLSNKKVPVLAISRSFHWNPDSYVQGGLDVLVSDLNSLPDQVSHIQDCSLIVYMAGSTNLSAAESDPVDDCQSHSDSLLAFLSRISGDQRLIFFSSGGTVYGEPINESSIESDPLNPKSAYGKRNKILEEIVNSFCSKNHIDHMALRLANPYGLDQLFMKRRGLVLSLMQSCLDHRCIKIRGSGLQRRDYFSVDDLNFFLSRFVDPMHSFPAEVLNIGSGKSLTAKEVVSCVTSLLGREPNVIYSADSDSSDVVNSSLDVTLLRKYLATFDPQREAFWDLSRALKNFNLEEFYNYSKMI